MRNRRRPVCTNLCCFIFCRFTHARGDRERGRRVGLQINKNPKRNFDGAGLASPRAAIRTRGGGRNDTFGKCEKWNAKSLSPLLQNTTLSDNAQFITSRLASQALWFQPLPVALLHRHNTHTHTHSYTRTLTVISGTGSYVHTRQRCVCMFFGTILWTIITTRFNVYTYRKRVLCAQISQYNKHVSFTPPRRFFVFNYPGVLTNKFYSLVFSIFCCTIRYRHFIVGYHKFNFCVNCELGILYSIKNKTKKIG